MSLGELKVERGEGVGEKGGGLRMWICGGLWWRKREEKWKGERTGGAAFAFRRSYIIETWGEVYLLPCRFARDGD